jgi:hypothetical protein
VAAVLADHAGHGDPGGDGHRQPGGGHAAVAAAGTGPADRLLRLAVRQREGAGLLAEPVAEVLFERHRGHLR